MRITQIIDKKAEAVPEKRLIQGYVPSELRDDVLAQFAKDKASGIKITWDSFLEAACLAYLSERKSK